MTEVSVVRVFTRGVGGGNHLGIVTDGVPRDHERMLAVAKEVGYSETIFLDASTSPPSVRIFTPFDELPFAGHPLVGAAWHLAHNGLRSRALRTPVGELRVGTIGDRGWFEVELAHPVRDFSGRYPSWLPDPVSVRVVDMPHPYVLWELPSADAVEGIEVGETDLWVYAYHRAGPSVRARFIVGDEFEDPATGSAAVALARCFLEDSEDSGELRIFQGEEMGHPSMILISWIGRRARVVGTVHPEPSRTVDVS